MSKRCVSFIYKMSPGDNKTTKLVSGINHHNTNIPFSDRFKIFVASSPPVVGYNCMKNHYLLEYTTGLENFVVESLWNYTTIS